MTPNTDINRLPSRRWAHPFDRGVPGPANEHGVDASTDAIGGHYGIGWTEYFRCHRTGEVYSVYCSDGVNYSKLAHSDRNLELMEVMRKRIIAHTRSQLRGPVKLSKHEWAIMSHFSFVGWLDELSRENENSPIRTVGDANRHLTEGTIGTIKGLVVVIDPKTTDDLPPVGDFGSENSLNGRTRTARFGGVFAAAFTKAGISV